ncbi:MAG: DUF3990 domain-containing protein [Lachnospiraceae bacterium]|nr:DUF3990 domain-containing protein [Lachnospiraceae bacterium]
MILYHGSNIIVNKPLFGYGKPYNDYGQGFYCTENIALAKEWACNDPNGGFVNIYNLDTANLNTLKLNEKKILEWLAILIKNRQIRYSSPIEKQIAEYVIANFYSDYSSYDIITGYRADDSYFSFVRAFLSNTISLEQLGEAMKLGNLGMQVFIQSQKAFDNLSFVDSETVSGDYYAKREERSAKARKDYYRLLEKNVTSGTFARDILKGGFNIDGTSI